MPLAKAATFPRRKILLISNVSLSLINARTMRVLCVAEKPSISKAVAGHLSGGSYQTVSRDTDQYVASIGTHNATE